MFVSDDGHALIGYLSRWTGLSESGIRYLEKKGVLQGDRSESGYRLFTDDDFLRLEVFRHYRDLGFSQDEAVDLGLASATEALEAMRAKLGEEEEWHRRAVAKLTEAIAQKQELVDAQTQPRPWRLEHMPSFLGLRSPLAASRGGEGEQPDPLAADLVEADLVWKHSVPTYIGSVYHLEGGVFDWERMTLCEIGEATGLPARHVADAVILKGCDALRFVTSGLVSQAESSIAEKALAYAGEAGVRVSVEGAVGRVLHMRRDGDDILFTLEVWAPIIGE